MHFHHRHDIAGCVDEHADWPDVARTILATLDRMEIRIMTAQQDSIDAAAAAITDLAGEVRDLRGQVTALEASQAPAADTTALDSAVAGAADVLPVPVPAPAAPADVPVAPAVDVPAADPNAPAASIPSVPLA